MVTPGGEDGFTLESPDLRSALAAIKEISPLVARNLRRELRRSGADIIEAQKAELDKPLPGNLGVSGTKLKFVRPRNGRKGYFAKRNVYEHVDSKRSGSTGMRDAIKAGLSTRILTGKTRSGVLIRTNKSKAPMSIVWQSSKFRHPVFNERNVGPYVTQKGQPYFWSPITGHIVQVRQRVADAINDALNDVSKL